MVTYFISKILVRVMQVSSSLELTVKPLCQSVLQLIVAGQCKESNRV